MDPIRIHHQDTPLEAHERHRQIEERLEHFGADQVRAMMGHGFPTEWNPIIVAWLNGQRLDQAQE